MDDSRRADGAETNRPETTLTGRELAVEDPDRHLERIRNEEGFTISNRVSIPRVAARIVRERLGLDDGSRDG